MEDIKIFTIAIIGVGNRGGVYAGFLAENKDVKIVAGCDICKDNVMSLNKLYNVDSNNLFTDESEFFAEKRADVLLIATLDGMHLAHAKKAMQLGYDLLLEKPIAPCYEDILEIENSAQIYGKKVVICHNLRYTPFYQTMKILIDSGEIGEVVSFEQSENVGYFHYIQSFVRGNWCDSKKTSSIILQKCCHDLDIMYWIIGKKCNTLSSIGSLDFYNHKHKPQNASLKCVDCKEKNCNYNALNIYTKYPGMMVVPYGFDKSKENIYNYLNDDNNSYGKCVFQSENDVCDRQVVDMQFEGGVVASLIMQGFAGTSTNRITRIYGQNGVIEGDINSGLITVSKIGQTPYTKDVNSEIITNSHSGGDAKLILDYVDYMNGKNRPLGISLLEDSVYSHRLAFEAELSRLNSGEVRKV